MNRSRIFTNPIAITDIETTGLHATIPVFNLFGHRIVPWHEIIEIGLILVDQETFSIINSFEVKIKPKHLNRAQSKALEVNGYNKEEWKDAVSLKKGMTEYLMRAENAVFCAHSVTFDWDFINIALMQVGLYKKDKNWFYPQYKICTGNLAWLKWRDSNIQSLSLKKLCQRLSIPPEPEPHRALTGALAAYEVFKRLI